jgi:predicted amidophosphoribosyltransferase
MDLFLDSKYFVKKKSFRSKICPDCGGFFTKTEDGYLCNSCGFELDKDGSSKSYFYGVITIKNK